MGMRSGEGCRFLDRLVPETVLMGSSGNHDD